MKDADLDKLLERAYDNADNYLDYPLNRYISLCHELHMCSSVASMRAILKEERQLVSALERGLREALRDSE